MQGLDRRVSWLEGFPPDIWAYMAFYLSGEELIRLKLSGATSLWHKISAPGVLRSVKLGELSLLSVSRLAILNDFPSIEELSFDNGEQATQDQDRIRIGIGSIPATVKKLAFYGGVGLAAHLFGGKQENALNLDEFLPFLHVLDLRQIRLPHYSWMLHSPPSLTDLKINLWDGTVKLPSSLRYFEASKVGFQNSEIDLTLPPQLEFFIAPIPYSYFDLIIPLLPDSLLKFFPGFWNRSTMPWLHQLPRSLTSLEMPIFGHRDHRDRSISLEEISVLPPALTELQARLTLPYSPRPMLPPNLKTLLWVPHTVDSTTSLGYCPFEILPRSITQINTINALMFCGPPPEPFLSCGSFFPPQLRVLDVRSIYLSPEATKLFPTSLTDLNIYNLCEKVSPHLPENLTKLTVGCAMMSPNLFKHLPKALTFLDLKPASQKKYWYDDKTGDPIDLPELPGYNIHMEYLLSDMKSEMKLPPNITELKLQEFENLGDSFMAHQHFPNMLRLHLPSSKLITNQSITLLNPHMTHLDLSQSSKIRGKCFPSLPRSLICLVLAESSSIFDQDIKHLPRNLKQLTLSMAICLTDECVQDFPRQLEIIRIQLNRTITPSSLPNFPYPFRSTERYSVCAEFFAWSFKHGKVTLDETYSDLERRNDS